MKTNRETPPAIPLPDALKNSSYVTLYLMPSPKLLDWSSPKALLKSTLNNSLGYSNHTSAGKKHAIGHVNIEIHDRREPDQIIRVGATGATAMDSLATVFSTHGLAGLHAVYEGHMELEAVRPGERFAEIVQQQNDSLERRPEIARQVLERAEKGHLSAVTFLVKDETAAFLLSYAAEYATNWVSCLGAQGYGRLYGLSNRPLYGEGAGCSAFAASFIELAGLLDPELSNSWSQLRFVPLRMTGQPCVNQPVRLGDVLADADRWGTANDGCSTMLHLWDPDLMHLWTEATWSRLRAQVPVAKDAACAALVKSKWLVIDRRATPTRSTGAIWRPGGRCPWSDPTFGGGRFRWLCDGTP